MATPTSTAPPSSITTPPPNQPKPTNLNPNQPNHNPPDLHYSIKTHEPCRAKALQQLLQQVPIVNADSFLTAPSRFVAQ